MKLETIVHIQRLLDYELTKVKNTHDDAALAFMKGKRNGVSEAELRELQSKSMRTMDVLTRTKVLHDDFFSTDWH